MTLSSAQNDRAAGVLLAAATGDALGVPYEFDSPPGRTEWPEMLGGGLGPYEPGEYSDDTQMAVVIARVAADGVDLREEDALDRIAEGFLRWRREGATDMGNLTSAVLRRTQSRLDDGSTGGVAETMREEAAARGAEHPSGGAGNGSLMRTAAVALAYLDDREAMAEAATAVSELTHPDPRAAEACVLWCEGIRVAVLEGTFDGVRGGLDLLPRESRAFWTERLDEAEQGPASRFTRNGWVVGALQAAYAAILHTPVPELDPANGSFPCLHLQEALAAAVRVGNDTDTVAAIAGALLGARWGASAVPFRWRRRVHGWPGEDHRSLVRLSYLVAHGGEGDAQGWPLGAEVAYGPAHRATAPHPADVGVLLGTVDADTDGVTALVSLCRLGTSQRPAWPGLPAADHHEAWLIDKVGSNENLHFVLDDAARAVEDLRGEGHTVLLHCVHAMSRTPTVAARCGMIAAGWDSREALERITTALPWAYPNGDFQAALADFDG